MIKNFTLFLLSAFSLLCLSPVTALADTLRLKNGNVLEGFIDKETVDSLEVNLGFGSVTLLKSEIASIQKSDAGQSQKIWNGWDRRKKEEDQRRPEEEKQRAEREAEFRRQEAEAERLKKENDEFGPKEVHVRTQNGHFFIPVLLNGKKQARLMLDSGASTIALPRRIADDLQIDVTQLKKESVRLADGRLEEAALCVLESVEVLAPGEKSSEFKATGIKIENVETTFLTRANDVITETPGQLYIPDDGLLGMSFLKNFQTQLDYENGKVIFQKNKSKN